MISSEFSHKFDTNYCEHTGALSDKCHFDLLLFVLSSALRWLLLKLQEKIEDINDAELEVFLPLLYLDPAFFKMSDYSSVFARGAAFGMALNFPLLVLGLVNPILMPVYLPCMTSAACILGIAFSAAAKGFQKAFTRAVSVHGIEAYLSYEDVRMPLARAYELCTKATRRIEQARILHCIDGRRICVRVKGFPDRTLVIRLDGVGRGITRIAIDCVKHVSLPQAIVIRSCWGAKFEQLILRLDDGLNAQLIEEISSFIREAADKAHDYELSESLYSSRR